MECEVCEAPHPICGFGRKITYVMFGPRLMPKDVKLGQKH